MYELTENGRAELERWLAEPADRSGGHRDEFVLKVMAAAARGEDAVREVTGRQRRHELGRLKGLGERARTHGDEPLVQVLVESAVLHTRADLALIEHVEGLAAALAASSLGVAAPTRGQQVTARASSA